MRWLPLRNLVTVVQIVVPPLIVVPAALPARRQGAWLRLRLRLRLVGVSHDRDTSAAAREHSLIWWVVRRRPCVEICALWRHPQG